TISKPRVAASSTGGSSTRTSRSPSRRAPWTPPTTKASPTRPTESTTDSKQRRASAWKARNANKPSASRRTVVSSAGPHVQEGARSQPRRNRRSHRADPARNAHRVGRRLQRSRSHVAPRPHGGRSASHRSRTRDRELPPHRQDP